MLVSHYKYYQWGFFYIFMILKLLNMGRNFCYSWLTFPAVSKFLYYYFWVPLSLSFLIHLFALQFACNIDYLCFINQAGGGGGDEVREPKREYTPAGRALKANFAKLPHQSLLAPRRSTLKPLYWSKETRALQGSLFMGRATN